MATRVYELAKELNMSNKDLLNRLNKMGIEVTSHMKALTDKDCNAVRNAVNAKSEAPKEAKPAAPKADRPAPKGDRPAQPRQDRPAGNRGDRPAQPRQDRPARGEQGDRPRGDRPARPGNRPEGGRPQGERRQGDRPRGDRPERGDRPARPGNRPEGGRPQGERRQGDRPAQPRQDRPAAAPRFADAPIRPENTKPSRNNDRRERKNDKKDDFEKRREGGKKNGKGGALNIAKPQHAPKKDHRKEQRKEAARKAEEEAALIPDGAIIVTVPITVKGLAEQIDVSTSQIIMTLMKMGIMANINQNLDEDVVMLLGEEFNKTIHIGNVEEEEKEEGIENFTDREDDLKPRPPIITVMGHVDHGKTSLLDRIRSTSVTASESGGITQHIGASEITHEGQRIVFLDTPGHEAFTAMRARGAFATDIAVLVVAADDSVKPQTIEAISHAKAANVPIIVAINKIDKPAANIDKVKQDLTEHGILIEDWGGDVICAPVSAKTGEGIDNLLEMILLQAEMLELKANPSRLALGTVIEARLDKQKGPVATLLVLNGTLHAGMSVVAGNCHGRIKAMTNFKGDALKKAGPATAVEILGFTEVPEAGDTFNAVSSDKVAREIAENRKAKQREEIMQKSAGVTLEQLFSQIEQGDLKQLNLIIKADVMGSVGALVSSLEKLKKENVGVRILHTGVGAINESDVMLASTSGAIIIGFNVRPSMAVSSVAQREGVEIRTYRVIYEVIEEVEAALKGMLDPEFKEQVLGTIEVRNTFKVPNVGIIAGAYVLDGKVERNAQIRLVREGIVIHEGKISSLKRFKDDAKEVARGYECGIGIENYNDIKEGDIMEAFKMVEVERK